MKSYVGLAAIVWFAALNGCCILPPRDVSKHASYYPHGYEVGPVYQLRRDALIADTKKNYWHTGVNTVVYWGQRSSATQRIPDSDADLPAGARFRVVKLLSACWNMMPGYYAHQIIPLAVIIDGPRAGTWVDISEISRLSFQNGDTHDNAILGPDPDLIQKIPQ